MINIILTLTNQSSKPALCDASPFVLRHAPYNQVQS